MDTTFLMSLLTWIGIFFCISQSAMFSGMNLALFSISRLRLEVEADLGNRDASKVLNMRKDSNFLLATVLWGNVGINVLLTLLSNSVLAGVSAFFIFHCDHHHHRRNYATGLFFSSCIAHGLNTGTGDKILPDPVISGC